MKKIVLIIILLFLGIKLQAQIKVPEKIYLDAFFKSKTYVVLEENPFSVWNEIIDSCMKHYWKITPYEIIAAADFDKKMKNPESSFLYLSLAQFTKGGDYIYNILNLSMGDASGDLNSLHDVCLMPVAYDEADEDSYNYKIGFLLEFLQNFVQTNRDNSGANIQDMVKQNMALVRNYELLILSSDLPVNLNNISKIKSIYPYPVKVVSHQEMLKTIESKPANTAFLHKVGPDENSVDGSQCLKFIFTLQDGKPLYFDYHKISNDKPNAFLGDDFKALAK